MVSVDDKKLEKLALIAITLGLIIANYAVFTGERIDGFYADEGKITLKGEIKEINKGGEWTYLKLDACRQIEGYYQGSIELEKNQEVTLEGDFQDDILNIDHYFIE